MVGRWLMSTYRRNSQVIPMTTRKSELLKTEQLQNVGNRRLTGPRLHPTNPNVGLRKLSLILMLLFEYICNKVDLKLTRFIYRNHSTYASVAASRDIGGGIARIPNPPKKAQASKDTGFDTCLFRRQPHRVWSLVSRVWRTQIPTHLVRRRARTLTSKTHSQEF
ncbi:uncharacterized protein LOC121419852 isoform X1 [Lytechinus variegatus]|uniref:uncharacterized protein LOC121419852 isoform X1 n=1 Tax=Lytechinus variegatus TaxID=7654 RepID=UPI001BB2A5A9|nr:uncharacterized protein LOC121419852 isoform X1 [Lytechinus variegatus]